MPAADLTLRPATPEDTDLIVDLMKVSLGEGAIPRQAEYWRWKHVLNPFGASPTLLAFAGDRLVGLRVFMRWSWRTGDQDVPAVRAVDTATHPEWQGRGIFSRLTLALLERMREEGVAFVFNTPNKRSRPGYLKMGWIDVGRPHVWIRPLGLLGAVGRSLGRGRLSAHGGPSDGSAGQDGSAPLGRPVAELLADGAFAGFAAALPQPRGRLVTRPTPAYLHWRYTDVPGFEYRADWRLEGTTGAAVVFRSKDTGRFRELRLCQVLVGDDARSRKVGRALIRSLLRRATADYASAMGVHGAAPHAVLPGCGFAPAPRLGPTMTIRPLVTVGGRPDPLRRSSWQLAIGDLELF